MGRTRSLMLPYLVFFAVVLLFDNAIVQVSGVAPSLNLADPRQIILRFFMEVQVSTGHTLRSGLLAAYGFR